MVSNVVHSVRHPMRHETWQPVITVVTYPFGQRTHMPIHTHAPRALARTMVLAVRLILLPFSSLHFCLSSRDLEKLGTPVFQVKGHTSIINAIDGIGGLNVGSGAPEIVTGSRDGCVKVWDVRQKEPVVGNTTQHSHRRDIRMDGIDTEKGYDDSSVSHTLLSIMPLPFLSCFVCSFVSFCLIVLS